MTKSDNQCSMGKPSIRFVNATKTFNIGSPLEKRALNKITLSIRQGEFVGITGLNGSGKSTLARMINGLVLPTSGEVYVNDLCTSDKKTITHLRSQVGMVFQNPDNQIVSPIIEEDISFGPTNLGLSRQEIKERTDWALELLGLEKLRHHSPHLLSGGQKQKVAIAAALAMRPSYLILDEPTSMLDTPSRQELMHNLKSLNHTLGITIVLISHLMEDLAEMNRLIVLDKGEIYLDESPRQVFAFSEKLTAIGISPPEIVQLLNALRRRGHKIDHNIITLNQIEEYICQLLK